MYLGKESKDLLHICYRDAFGTPLSSTEGNPLYLYRGYFVSPAGFKAPADRSGYNIRRRRRGPLGEP